MPFRNPWKTLKQTVRYENPWFRVREDEVIRPDGKPGIYGVVETRIATGVVALTEANEVVLVGQYRYPTEQYSWEIIEGGAEEGELPLEAIKRELKEEAGLIANSWQQLGPEVQLSNCISSELAVFFIARDLTETEASPDGTEVLQTKTVSFDECMSLVESGEINDAMSIIGLHRAKSFLEQTS